MYETNELLFRFSDKTINLFGSFSSTPNKEKEKTAPRLLNPRKIGVVSLNCESMDMFMHKQSGKESLRISTYPTFEIPKTELVDQSKVFP